MICYINVQKITMQNFNILEPGQGLKNKKK